MDPTSRVIAMGAAGAGSSVVNFAAILNSSTVLLNRPVSAVDSDNNFYIAFSSSHNPYRTYLAKYSSLATLVWQVEITQPNGYGVLPYDIVIDSNKDIIIATGLYTSFNFAYTPQLIKLNSSGSLLWSNGFTGAGQYNDSSFTGVTVDSSNNIYAVIALSSRRTLCSFNSSGTLLSQSSITSPSGDSLSPQRIKCRGSDLYVLGVGVTSSGFGSMGVARFNTSGSFISGITSQKPGSGINLSSSDLTIDTSGNVYAIAGVSSNYPIVFKYTSGLSISWKRESYTGTYGASRLGISVGGTNNDVYISSPVGSFASTASSRAIQSINSVGSLVWERSISGGDYFDAGTVAVASTGDVLCVQHRYTGSLYDIVSYLIPPNGNKTGTYLGTTYSSASYGISSTSTNDYSLNLSLTASSLSVVSFTINVSASSLTSTIANLV